MVPVVIGALGAVILKLGEWPQQIAGRTSEVFVQKNTILEQLRYLAGPTSQAFGRGPELEEDTTTSPKRGGFIHTCIFRVCYSMQVLDTT